ncbi:MFS transporter [Siccirubricoccus sp. KC 17139]|uniref:MFS transporter n=1 Tax=Siccirubricoccus soli TaxID=2899147 RepID=A0ABT1D990_9PROT|nr:MFS transporter [Siccirubricoccus soli]MCO6418506.1 MFS transporter [Siccirubricoccus soli]MCP2684641.1 MFS transporter [Siccirubricoccus soli]
MPPALFALTAGAFGIGVTEFVVMGLLIEIGADLRISIAAAGTLISGYALGVVAGAPLITAATSRFSRRDVLLGLMLVFTLGNLACAVAPSYGWLMAARVLTAFAHGTFFGVGSVVAAGLVAPDKRASAIAIMFTGLTLANILGVPFGTWLGQTHGWRATFWAVTAIGLAVMPAIALLVPRDRPEAGAGEWRRDLEVMRRLPVLLGFLTTVLGFAGVFAVFTYVAPLLTRVSGLSDAAVSPVLLVFGGGLVLGNLLGGKLADRGLMPALLGTLAALAAVLLAMAAALPNPVTAVAAVFLLGAAGFATVPPLQSWVLQQAAGAGQSLAASFNIAAFNLGNALGAWLGGVTIEHGPGLAALPLVAALLPLSALGLAWLGREAARRQAVA